MNYAEFKKTGGSDSKWSEEIAKREREQLNRSNEAMLAARLEWKVKNATYEEEKEESSFWEQLKSLFNV